MLEELVRVGRRGSEMNNPDLSFFQLVNMHESSIKKRLVNGLVRFKGDLVFVNEDKDIGQVFDFLYKGMKLVAVEDAVSKLWWKARLSLFHPLHRGEARNEEYMVSMEMLNKREHRARFARLSQGDSQDGVNVVVEGVGNVFSERDLVRKHGSMI
jgi:hypothetical protein